MSRQSEFGAALAQPGSSASASLLRLDSEIVASGLVPDLYEYSAKADTQLQPWRATYYFDVGRHPAELAGAVDQLFLRAASALNIRLGAFPDFLGQAGWRSQLVQTVLGIDAREDAGSLRLKYYWVLKPNSGALLGALLTALGLERQAPRDLDKVYICGLDFTQRGLLDVKLYYVLEQRRVPAFIQNFAAVRELFAGTRLVVYQHCLRAPDKRQMFFHATRSAVIQRELLRQSRRSASALELLQCVERMRLSLGAPSAVLGEDGDRGGHRLEPWILAFPYSNRVLDLNAFNVYFHVGE